MDTASVMPPTTGSGPLPMPQKPYNQACVLQKVAFDRATDPETKPNVAALLMRAWKELEEQKRILRMRPAPKPIDVSPKRKRSAGPSVVHMPIAPDPVPGAQSAQQ